MLRTSTTLPCLLLAALATATPADVLTTLPAAYAQKLQPVDAISLETLDADSRAQLQAARQRVVDALNAATADAELADAYGELGALYQLHMVTRAAGDCYDNAIRLAPETFRWQYYRAYLDATSGEMQRAIDGYRRAQPLRPDYLPLTLRLADAWRELDRTDEAAAAYRTLLDETGLSAEAHYGLGQIALLQRDFPAAISHFERTLALQPQASRVHYGLGQALRASGDSTRAAQEFGLMGDTEPTFTDPLIASLQALKQGAHLHFLLAMKAYHKHDYAQARDEFASGLEREPDNVNARISYARALYLSGDRDGAREQLASAVAAAPDDALGWFLLGVLTEEGGDADQAGDDYRAALRADPAHAGAHFYLGNDDFRQGRTDAAAAHYASSIDAIPENLAAWLAYTGVLLQSGARQQAVALVERALTRFPEQDLLAQLQLELQCLSGDPAQARSARQAIDKRLEQQSTPPLRELQALALAASGDYPQAIRQTDGLLAEAAWAMPMAVPRLNKLLTAYRDGKLPATEDLFTWSVLQAPAVQGSSVFRDYPAPKPY